MRNLVRLLRRANLLLFAVLVLVSIFETAAEFRVISFQHHPDHFIAAALPQARQQRAGLVEQQLYEST